MFYLNFYKKKFSLKKRQSWLQSYGKCEKYESHFLENCTVKTICKNKEKSEKMCKLTEVPG